MNARIPVAAMISALVLGASCAWAKIPPPPPPDEKAKAAAEEKKAKDAAAAEKAKADQAAVEEATVKNFQANMKKKGKPIPKPTPIAAAAPAKPAAAPAKPGEAAKAAEKKDAKK
jgi:rod shape-determining protein MreC